MGKDEIMYTVETAYRNQTFIKDVHYYTLIHMFL